MPEVKQDTLILQELVRRANLHTQRLRNIDEQIRSINSKIENIEQQKIKENKVINEKFSKVMGEIEVINKSISDLKNEILKIQEKNKIFAKRSEVEELSKFVDLLSPMKHEFVTWKEFNREIKKLKNEISIQS